MHFQVKNTLKNNRNYIFKRAQWDCFCRTIFIISLFGWFSSIKHEQFKNLKRIPSSISGLKSPKRLDVSDCSKLKNIPENLGEVESLEEFDACGNSIRQSYFSFEESYSIVF